MPTEYDIMKNFFRTLRGRFLITLILTGIFPFSVIAFVLITTQVRTLRALAGRELSQTANIAAQDLTVFVQNALTSAQAIAALPAIVSMDPAQQGQTLAQLHKPYHWYSQFDIITPDTGKRLLLPASPALAAPADLASFRKAAQGQQDWGIAPISPTNAELRLHIHTPIFNAGRVVGVLESPVTITSLTAILETHVFSNSNVLLLDQQGQLLLSASQQPSAPTLRLPLFRDLRAEQVTQHTDTIYYKLAGYERIAGIAPLPQWGWTVVVDRPALDVTGSAYQSLRVALSGFAISILLNIIAAAMLANTLTRPVRRVVMAARALGEGNSQMPVTRSPTDDDDIATLVQAFERMRRAVVQREASIRRHLSAIEATSDGLVMLDEHFCLIYANDAAVKIYGYSQAQALLGHSWLELHAPANQPKITGEVFQAVQSKGQWHGEVEGLRPDGSSFAAETSLTRIETGEVVCVVHDITERKEAERALQQTQKLESLGVLAGGVAHDFNNLLTAIAGSAALAKRQLTATDAAYQPVETVLRSTERAADLTRQLLAYAGKGQFVVEPLDLMALIRENVLVLETAIPHRANLVIELPEALPPILADRGQVQQVLMNMVINAAEALDPSGGTVVIKAGLQASHFYGPADNYIGGIALQPGDYVCLEVTDNGVGMTAETLARIFDPFFTTKSYGRGLGLSATLGIIRTLGGAIQVQSRPGEGSTFRILFPAHHTTMEPTMPTVLPVPTAHTGTALIIDDEESIRAVVAQILQEIGFDVLAACNGAEGVEVFRSHQPQVKLILLDSKMPVMDGEEAYQQIRQLDRTVPIILSSGYSETKLPCPRNDAQLSFLQKPYQMDDFVSKIDEAVTVHNLHLAIA